VEGEARGWARARARVIESSLLVVGGAVFAIVSKREENGGEGRRLERERIAIHRDRDGSSMTRRSERSRIAPRISERWRARPRVETH